MNYVHSASPPFLILHGESDALVPWKQSQLLYEALSKAGNEVTLVKYERLGHGFFNNSDLDGTEIGQATAITSGDPRGSITSATSKVFALCEEFFRFYLAERARGFNYLTPLNAWDSANASNFATYQAASDPRQLQFALKLIF